jgi:hypothetical protein
VQKGIHVLIGAALEAEAVSSTRTVAGGIAEGRSFSRNRYAMSAQAGWKKAR